MKLRIGPHVWKVRFSARAAHASSHAEGDTLFGSTLVRKLRITVAPDCPPSQRRETLLHEVLHACVSCAGLEEELGDQEEKVVNRLAKVLLPALRDNPKLVRYLLEDE